MRNKEKLWKLFSLKTCFHFPAGAAFLHCTSLLERKKNVIGYLCDTQANHIPTFLNARPRCGPVMRPMRQIQTIFSFFWGNVPSGNAGWNFCCPTKAPSKTSATSWIGFFHHTPAVCRSWVNTPIWRRSWSRPQSRCCWPKCWPWKMQPAKQRPGPWRPWPSCAMGVPVQRWLSRSPKCTAAAWTRCWGSEATNCSCSARTPSSEPGCCQEAPARKPWR